MQGIFDKWTWEGTGVFAISIALPIGLKLFTFIRERYAIHKLYKEMKADFSKRFINQRSAQGGFRQPKLHNKFAYVQGYSTKGVNSQIKKTAKAIYKSRQANQKVSKIEKFTTKYLTPAINAIVTALSAWATYQQIDYCQTIANDMQNTSITVTNQRNKIEDMKVNLVDPVLRSVQSRWSRVKSFMAKKTTLDWLDGIKKLSLGAKSPDVTAANTIQDFISKIASAGVHNTLKLQTKLIKALKSVEFEFECLRDKQHAVTLVVKDCRTGRAPLNELYKDADSKYRLNRRKCIDSKRVPYTSFKQFRQIVKQIANKQKWSCKCLLNNRDLLIRVCDEKLKGHTTPEEILKQVNKKELDKSMVLDFLKRCPPPKITRKKRINTCKNYCRYMSVADMAKLELLWEKQVRQIIIKCPICSVSPSQKNTICYDYFCKRIKATTIEAKVRKPLPTVKHVIRKVCTQKCVPKAADKKKICRMYKCKVFSLSKIAKSLGLPLASVKKTTARCDIILPSCGPISAEDRKKVLNLHCKFNASAESIHAFKLVDLPLSAIKYIIRSTTCKEFKKKNKSG